MNILICKRRHNFAGIFRQFSCVIIVSQNSWGASVSIDSTRLSHPFVCNIQKIVYVNKFLCYQSSNLPVVKNVPLHGTYCTSCLVRGVNDKETAHGFVRCQASGSGRVKPKTWTDSEVRTRKSRFQFKLTLLSNCHLNCDSSELLGITGGLFRARQAERREERGRQE